MKIDVITPHGVEAERDKSSTTLPLRLKSIMDAETRIVKVTIRGRRALATTRPALSFQISNSSYLGLPY